MSRLFFLPVATVLSIVTSASAQSPGFVGIDRAAVVVCPARASDREPPSFTAKNCRTVSLSEVSARRRLVWIKAQVELSRLSGPGRAPLAVFISGKLSSAVYINGVRVGTNGSPGAAARTETPGRMDAVVHAPQSVFRTGPNALVLKASAHHGILDLVHPIHAIGIGPAHDPTRGFLAYYWPSLPTLGLFVLAGIYFAASSLVGEDRRSPLALLSICMCASGQVLAEVYRGLVSYPYPVHDFRLIFIVLFSAGFGVSVAHLAFGLFDPKRVWPLTVIALALSLGATLTTSGFDQKAAGAMLAPLVLSLPFLGYWSHQRRSRAVAYFVIVFGFVVANVTLLSFFLDVVFFYMVGALLLVLLTEQAIAAARDAQLHRLEEARANRLELALVQAQEVERATELSIKSAGRVERITSEQILHCRGAGGYTEIIAVDGRTLLHSASLAEMEELLPASFIRVHRSHVVNTRHVRSLERTHGGTGTLILSDNTEVPVSRRIMPAVRQALASPELQRPRMNP
ncbi:MAG: LytTR family DNA-binding domain-containing protein [Myxococcota bacterium]